MIFTHNLPTARQKEQWVNNVYVGKGWVRSKLNLFFYGQMVNVTECGFNIVVYLEVRFR